MGGAAIRAVETGPGEIVTIRSIDVHVYLFAVLLPYVAWLRTAIVPLVQEEHLLNKRRAAGKSCVRAQVSVRSHGSPELQRSLADIEVTPRR